MIETTVAIVGSGFGGQCMAISLRKMGLDDFLLLERREFMGGTWKQNQYPGAAVDVQSLLYSIAGEPWDWSQIFAPGDELRTYTDHVIRKHGLRERTKTHCNVEKATWVESEHRWHLKTSSGETVAARFVVNASGPLSQPVIPEFKGAGSFQGKTFHTNAWDHSYDLRGKRVAIIGSGASAAQVIPTIAPEVGHLHVFQRSPHWVLPRPDRVLSRWERALLKFRPINKLARYAFYWGLETRVIAFKYSPWLLKNVMQRIATKHIRNQVKDPELQKKLTPDFVIGCKRILMSNTYYPTFNRPNVTLHDKHDGIVEITPTGIKTAQGHTLDVDCIVYSTGYDASQAVPYEVEGREGQTLSGFWRDYMRAYLGITLPKMPNLFLIMGPNTGIGHTSAIFIIESQMEYITRAIRKVLKKGAAAVDVKPEAEAAWTTHVHEEMKPTVWATGGCTSWYKGGSDKVLAMYPGFSFVYRLKCRMFKDADHVFLGKAQAPGKTSSSNNPISNPQESAA